jgi:uridine kinase
VTSPFIVALAGPPGCGKTTLAMALTARLPDGAVLCMDGFDIPAGMSADALEEWLDDGADFAALRVPGLAEALKALKAGRSVTEPLSGRWVVPARVVLFEMPLGRTSPAIAPLIDRLVWIEVPLDVALARNLLAFDDAADGAAQYLTNYLSVTRRVLDAQSRMIAPDADLVVDGLLDSGVLAEQVIGAFGLRP